jgi:hypothetical protein
VWTKIEFVNGVVGAVSPTLVGYVWVVEEVGGDATAERLLKSFSGSVLSVFVWSAEFEADAVLAKEGSDLFGTKLAICSDCLNGVLVERVIVDNEL